MVIMPNLIARGSLRWMVRVWRYWSSRNLDPTLGLG